MTHALEPALDAYARGTGLTRVRLNRAVVCNAGILIGALAVADRDSALSAEVVPLAVEHLREAMQAYGPDGAWPEGPTYWGYATRYAITAIAASNGKLGTDFGLSDVPGFAQTAAFGIQVTGPTGAYFNFGDAPERESEAGDATASLFWLARRFDQPTLAAIALDQARHGSRASARALLWFPARAAPASAPVDALFRGPNVVTLRSGWTDADAIFVGIKGGDTIEGHTHFDRGSFVLDALGTRWALDLGPDEYALPGYFRGRRGSYYRVGTEGHNTVRIDGRNQLMASAGIIAFSSTDTTGAAVLDLSAAYRRPVARALRGVQLDRARGRVLVQDELTLQRAAGIEWSMHTRAAVAVAGSTATLTQDGRTLYARILAPAGATFEVEALEAAPRARSLEGVRALRIRLAGAAGSTRVAVAFTLRRDPGESPLRPLEQWPGAGTPDP